MFELRLTNLQAVIRKHAAFAAQNDRMLVEAIEAAVTQVHHHVQTAPKFKPRTGFLQRSTKTKVKRLKSGRLLVIDNTAPYADSIDGGAKPHVISARRVSHLAFFWKKVGRFIRTKSVNHPGNRPYKFMYRAWQSAGRTEEQYLRYRMGILARRF